MRYTEPDTDEKIATKGVRLIHREEQECHALRGNEYAVLYIMERDGERRVSYYSDSFYVRIPTNFDPRMWIQAGMQQDTPAQTAAYLLDQGWFPAAAAYLRLIAYPDQVAKDSAINRLP